MWFVVASEEEFFAVVFLAFFYLLLVAFVIVDGIDSLFLPHLSSVPFLFHSHAVTLGVAVTGMAVPEQTALEILSDTLASCGDAEKKRRLEKTMSVLHAAAEKVCVRCLLYVLVVEHTIYLMVSPLWKGGSLANTPGFHDPCRGFTHEYI